MMTFLSDDVAADGTERGTIVTWDTRTGEHTTVPLSYSSTPALEADAIDYGHFDVMSLNGERFEWVAPDGRFLSTDVSTGKTRLLFDTGIGNEVGGDGTSLWALGATKVHAFHQDYTDDASPLTYHVFDRATGEQVTETELPIRSDEINVSYLGWWRGSPARMSKQLARPAHSQHDRTSIQGKSDLRSRSAVTTSPGT
jgi:hypothetical protein